MKIFFLLVATALFVSCDSESSAEEEPFFNLEVGNQWVYKRYNAADGVNFTASTYVDSVSITGATEIEGMTYAIRTHKIYSDGIAASNEYDEYVREDENGHLVMPSGFVIHPGDDQQYTANRSVTTGEVQVGTVFYTAGNPFTATVEGSDYYVYPYIGDYVPVVDDGMDKFIYDYYEQGLGLVCQHCSFLNGPGVYQDRLVWYDLN